MSWTRSARRTFLKAEEHLKGYEKYDVHALRQGLGGVGLVIAGVPAPSEQMHRVLDPPPVYAVMDNLVVPKIQEVSGEQHENFDHLNVVEKIEKSDNDMKASTGMSLMRSPKSSRCECQE